MPDGPQTHAHKHARTQTCTYARTLAYPTHLNDYVYAIDPHASLAIA